SPPRRAWRRRWSSRPRPSPGAATRRISGTAWRRSRRSSPLSSTAVRSVLARSLLGSLLVLALAAPALAWRLSYGAASANRVAAGDGTVPRRELVQPAAGAPSRLQVLVPQ